jgi:hypothetical protein
MRDDLHKTYWLNHGTLFQIRVRMNYPIVREWQPDIWTRSVIHYEALRRYAMLLTEDEAKQFKIKEVLKHG